MSKICSTFALDSQRRRPSGFLLALIKDMIEKKKIEEIIAEFLKDSEVQLINLNVSPQNEILVEVDAYKGVDLDFCAALSRYIQAQLDREVEDFELEVGTVSITDPFRTKMQYEKHLGHDGEILTKDGRK